MKTVVQGQVSNFETLVDAIKSNRACLMECTFKITGEKVAVICVVNINEEPKEQFEMIPLALFLNGNPYELLEPPVVG